MGKPAETDRRPLKSLSHSFTLDFIITGRTKELLEGEIKPLVEQFLQKRGLELSPVKTVITHVEKGFDFLGQNVRKYPNGKLLIKPSKKNVKTFLGGIRKIIRAALGMSAADVIHELNPKIRGWANYHRHVVSKRTYVRVDHESSLVYGDGHDEDTRTRTRAGANRSTLRRIVVMTGPSSVKRGMTRASPVKFGCARP